MSHYPESLVDYLCEDWKPVLNSVFNTTTFKHLNEFVLSAYSTTTCFPPKSKLFNAFNLCALQDIKVVLIGQDPYHNIGQAQGLSFSVPEHCTLPPSLKNIFKELDADLGIKKTSGNLEKWANQGVFLLNSTLSVEAHNPASHCKKGWEFFTDEVIKIISTNTNGVVFLLWGSYAQKKQKHIQEQNHLVLTSGHPSPLSANRGLWFGNKHFSKTNIYLKQQGKSIINW